MAWQDQELRDGSDGRWQGLPQELHACSVLSALPQLTQSGHYGSQCDSAKERPGRGSWQRMCPLRTVILCMWRPLTLSYCPIFSKFSAKTVGVYHFNHLPSKRKKGSQALQGLLGPTDISGHQLAPPDPGARAGKACQSMGRAEVRRNTPPPPPLRLTSDEHYVPAVCQGLDMKPRVGSGNNPTR